MNDECPLCRDYAAAGSSYCGSCGRYLGKDAVGSGSLGNTDGNTDPTETPRSFLELVLQLLCIFIIIIAVIEVAVMILNIGDVFSFLDGKFTSFIVIVPFPQVIFETRGSTLQAYWILLAAVIVVCVTTAIMKFIKVTKEGGGILRPGASENTAVFWVCIFLSAMLLIHVIIVLFTEASGTTVQVPDFGSYLEQMFLFADAAVWEEVIARVLYIGVPFFFISLIATKKFDSWKCLFGGFGMSKVAVVLIIISGIIFGLAHYPGWEDQAWKVLATGIMGMFLGYVFVRFGLYASILMHFINDYLSSFDWIGAGGVSYLITYLLIVIGFFALCYIFVRVFGSKGLIKDLPNFKIKCTKL